MIHKWLWVAFGVGAFLFFELNFRYWYRFMEQYSLFLFTDSYFLALLKQPGGLNGYAAAFLTQFFVLPFVPAACIAALLTLGGLLFGAIWRQTSGRAAAFLPFLPAFLSWAWPVESIAPVLAVAAALGAVRGYVSVRKAPARYAAGFALLAALYLAAAPAHLLAAMLMAVYEICTGKKRLHGLALGLGFCGWALAVSLLAMRTLYVVPMREAFLSKHLFHPEHPVPVWFPFLWLSFPLLLGVENMLRKRELPVRREAVKQALPFAALAAVAIPAILCGKEPLEQVYYYDWLARQQQWGQITAHADRHPPKDKDALTYVNLAYAHQGRLPEALLRFPQTGADGFIPFDPKTRLGWIEASEVAWLMNHTNSAQRYAFIGVLSSERNVQPRLMERLVEAFIVNGEYKAAGKYIRILGKTFSYRKRMKELHPLLDPGVAASTPWVAGKRRLNPITDNPYDLTKTFPDAVAYLIDDHLDNQAAFSYGMAFLLIYKNLGAFMNYMELAKGKSGPLPALYQEAICFYYHSLENNPEAFQSYGINPEVYNRFRSYMQQVRSLPPTLLAKQFGDTYYYYAQFIEPPKTPAR